MISFKKILSKSNGSLATNQRPSKESSLRNCQKLFAITRIRHIEIFSLYTLFYISLKFAKILTLSLPECLIEFCNVTLTFESVDQILWCDHSNKSSLPVLSHGAICFSKFHKIKFGNLVEIFFWLNLAVKGLITC